MEKFNIFFVLTTCMVLLFWTAVPVFSSALKTQRVGNLKSSQITPFTSGSEYLDTEQKYMVTWLINGTDKEETIYFEVTAQTKGYVGFGLSPNGGMQGADILFAGVNPDGSIYSSDRHAEGTGMPIEDINQNWYVTFGEETETHTMLKFHRLINTCDDDDFRITDGTTRIIWALGETDAIEYHKTSRGTHSVNFYSGGVDDFNPEQYLNITLTVTTPMPSQHTTYWCTLHQLPLFTEKQHIVAFEPVLENPEALAHTHHFLFHRCIAPAGQNPDDFFGKWVGQPGDFCYDQKIADFPFSQYCDGNLVYVWSKGGKRMVFPPDIGLPMPDKLGEREYYIMEIHYDNPGTLEGLSFSTGGRLFYTPDLRDEEAGLLLVQHSTNVALTIPPNAQDYVVAGHCSSECTQEILPEGGVTVFNNLLHAHLAARKLKLRHFRGTEELEWMDRDDYYDFDFQQNKPLTHYRKLERGDHMTIECTYDTTKVEGTKAVMGGLSSHEEMCQSWMFYYPRQESEHCGSSQDGEHFSLFGITDIEMRESDEEGGLPTYYIMKPDNLTGDYIESISYKVNWTQEFRETFQQEKRYGQQIAICGKDSKFQGRVTKYPENFVPYQPPNDCEGVTQPPTGATSAEPTTESSAVRSVSLGFINVFLVTLFVNKIC